MNTDLRFALWIALEALAVVSIFAALIRGARLWRIAAVTLTVAGFCLGIFLWTGDESPVVEMVVQWFANLATQPVESWLGGLLLVLSLTSAINLFIRCFTGMESKEQGSDRDAENIDLASEDSPKMYLYASGLVFSTVYGFLAAGVPAMFFDPWLFGLSATFSCWSIWICRPSSIAKTGSDLHDKCDQGG